MQDAKNRQKFAVWAPSHKLSGYIFATNNKTHALGYSFKAGE